MFCVHRSYLVVKHLVYCLLEVVQRLSVLRWLVLVGNTIVAENHVGGGASPWAVSGEMCEVDFEAHLLP